MNKYRDTINPGDRVSWRLKGDCQRHTGVLDAIYYTSKNERLFAVTERYGSGLLLYARDVTKECE